MAVRIKTDEAEELPGADAVADLEHSRLKLNSPSPSQARHNGVDEEMEDRALTTENLAMHDTIRLKQQRLRSELYTHGRNVKYLQRTSERPLFSKRNMSEMPPGDQPNKVGDNTANQQQSPCYAAIISDWCCNINDILPIDLNPRQRNSNGSRCAYSQHHDTTRLPFSAWPKAYQKALARLARHTRGRRDEAHKLLVEQVVLRQQGGTHPEYYARELLRSDIIAVINGVTASKEKTAADGGMEVDMVENGVVGAGETLSRKQKQRRRKQRNDREDAPVWAPKYGSKPAGMNGVRNFRRRTAMLERAQNSPEVQERALYEASSVEASLIGI